MDCLRCVSTISQSSASACPNRTSDVPSEENKSKEQKAAESDVESFRKDLGPFVVAARCAIRAMKLCDVNLNGEMSYPIADALTARCVPFVFVTGYDKNRMLEGYRNCPVLQKPFHRAELSATLARLLTPKEPTDEPAPAGGR